MRHGKEVARKRRVMVGLTVLCALAVGALLLVAAWTDQWAPWLSAAVSFVSASSIWSVNAWRAGEVRA